ncbi:MAG: cation:proton antiporter, partial [Clostridia bacterium]
VVTAVFAIVMVIVQLPIYLAFIFGGIALATAPAPALSIVNEFKTRGPVTRTLIPLAALDDVVGVCVFFTVISIVSSMISTASVSPWLMIVVVLAPFVIGIAVGAVAGLLLKKERKPIVSLLLLLLPMAAAIAISLTCDFLLFEGMSINYILLGMAFSSTFANIVGEERLKGIMQSFNPILNVSLVVVILNLGMPLDYKLIVGAGVFTLIYIVARAAGKIGGAYLGAKMTNAEPTIRKYLGLTLLPHSGVSLVFTGIAVSALAGPAPECARILQGTIAAAAIINEIIAVILAKQAFKWAGEMNQQGKADALPPPTQEEILQQKQDEFFPT